MSWTVACFCGTVYEAPPDRCPTCASPVPDAHTTGRMDDEPQRPDDALLPTTFGSLEHELAKLTASALPG